MSSDAISCPYCNSFVPAGAPGSRRLTCPRCGESFPYRDAEITATLPAAPAAPNRNGAEVSRFLLPERRPWSNRRIALGILGLMGVLALLSLAFALYTVPSRRSHDFKPYPTAVVVVPRRSLAPAELPALGYLPPGTNVVLGINVADALRTPAGKAFLEHAQLGSSGLHVADLEHAIGLKREEIDHIVFGVRVEAKQPLRVVLVAQTVRPYDAEGLRKTLKATRASDAGKRRVDHVTLEKPRLSGVLWCPSDRIIVLGLSAQDIEAVPEPPATAAENLPEPLQKMLKEKLPAGAQAFLVGHADKMETVRGLLTLSLAPEDREPLMKVRTFGFWLTLDQKIGLNAAIRCEDDAGAESVDKALAKGKGIGPGYLKVLGSGAAADAVAKELAESVKRERKGEWVTITATAGAETVAKALEQLKKE